MSTVIIIGGTGRLRAAIDAANQDASQYNWTQAEKDSMADLFNSFADQINVKIADYNK